MALDGEVEALDGEVEDLANWTFPLSSFEAAFFPAFDLK